MKLIVAVDSGWGIGYQGELLTRVSADLKNFRTLTTGKVVVLGSKTMATFPGGRPLKNRVNIVMSRRSDYAPEGATVVHSTAELLTELKKYDTDDVFVIGGASVYAELLPYCDTAIVTKFDREFQSDAFFPNLDEDKDWICTDSGALQAAEDTDDIPGMEYRITEYKRV